MSIILIYFWSQHSSRTWVLGQVLVVLCKDKPRSKYVEKERKKNGKRRLSLFLMIFQLPHDAPPKFAILSYIRHFYIIKIYPLTLASLCEFLLSGIL